MNNNSIQSPQDGINNINSIVGAFLASSSGGATNSSVAMTPSNSSQETASAAAQSASSSFSTLAPTRVGTNNNTSNSNSLNSFLSSIMLQNIPRQDELLLKQALAAANIGRTGNLNWNGQQGAGAGLANGGSSNTLSYQNQQQAGCASVGHAQNDLFHFGNGLSEGQNSLLLQQQRLLQLERQKKDIASRQDEERSLLLSSLSNQQQQQLLKNQGSSQLESQQQQILLQLQQVRQQNNSDQIANQLLLQLLCQQQSQQQQRQADSNLSRLQAMSSSSGTGVDQTSANQNALAQLLATAGQSSQRENGLLELILLKQKEDNIRRLLQGDGNHDQNIQQERSTPLHVFNAVEDISSRQNSLPVENNSLSYLLNTHQRPALVASGIASNISPMEESDVKEHFSLQNNGLQNFPTTIFETDQSNSLEVSLNTKKDPPKQKSKKRELPNDAPRKPLSAYNFFFSDERVRILDSIPDPSTGEIHIPSIDITPSDYKNSDGPGPATVSDKSEKTESISSVSSDNGSTGDKGSESDKSDESIDLEKSASEDDIQFAPILQKYSNKKKTKRSHSKTHGKIDFTVLSRRVGDRWRNLSKRERSYYQRLAAADSRRYKREMEEYTKINGKNGT